MNSMQADHGDNREHSDHKHTWWEALPVFHHHIQRDASADASPVVDAAGSRTLWQSLAILAATALFQLAVALLSHSVSLLADTIHNAADALTAVPLLIAFRLARRPPTSRFTYGYGRVEDIAGVAIVLVIGGSAGLAAWGSVQKLLHPAPMTLVGWVIIAAIDGFAGNELVARQRIRIGKAIGSAALVADGQHARADGITSLAVLLGAVGGLVGVPLLDPVVGLLITGAILAIVREAATAVWGRLLDAVDPALVAQIAATAERVPSVVGVHAVRARWVGHQLFAELHVCMREDASTLASHRISEAVHHELLHTLPRLASLAIHIDPASPQQRSPEHDSQLSATRLPEIGYALGSGSGE
jgi:cation diffusion facilitator family transporter